LFKNKKINVIITVVITKKNGIKCLKKKKKQRLCCSGKKCNFCVQIVSNFLWGQDPKTKKQKNKKKGGRNNFIFGSKNNIRRYRKLRGDENRKLKT